MLLKVSNADLVEQVRADPRVRETFDFYREIVNESEGAKRYMKLRIKLYNKAHGTKFDFEKDLLSGLILRIGNVYWKLKRESPKTVKIDGPFEKKRPFDSFVRDVFLAEGLDPPGSYKIRKGLKYLKPTSK